MSTNHLAKVLAAELDEGRRRTLDVYERWSAIPLVLTALTWMVGFFLITDPLLHPMYAENAGHLIRISYLIFVIDVCIRFVLIGSLRIFLRTTWPVLIALLVPVLRLVLVVLLILRITRKRTLLAEKVFAFAALALVIVVVLGGLFTLMFEIRDPSANITSLGDASWWAMVTVVTVGYGDYYPITIGGRLVAVVVMLGGAAVVSSFTAAIASRWIGNSRGESSQATVVDTVTEDVLGDPDPVVSPMVSDAVSHVDHLQAEVTRLSGLVERLLRHHGVPDGTDVTHGAVGAGEGAAAADSPAQPPTPPRGE